MTDATALAKRLREWASRLDDACGPHEALVLLDSSADLLESQAVRIAELELRLEQSYNQREADLTSGMEAANADAETLANVERKRDELQAEIERLKAQLAVR